MAQKTNPMSYGFIGLGVMGWGMARNLRAKIPEASTFHVCEVVKERLGKWVANAPGKVEIAANPREIVERSDVIITMLPRGEHVQTVFCHPKTGLLTLDASSSKRTKLFVDCSTIDVQTSKEVSEAVNTSGLGTFADAPVSGGVRGADMGTLTFMIGSPPELFEDVRSIAAYMGAPESIFHCGGVGAGLATKQINNYVSAAIMIAVCEGMNMGRLYGLDPRTLASVMNASTGMSYNGREQNPVKGVSEISSAARDFQGGFSTELCYGVLEMAIALAKQLGAKTVLSPAVNDLYKRAVASDRCKGMDYRSIYHLFSDDDVHDLD